MWLSRSLLSKPNSNGAEGIFGTRKSGGSIDTGEIDQNVNILIVLLFS